MEGTLASNMRVAAMGAIAAKHLARQDSEVIGFIGAGEQATQSLESLVILRPDHRQAIVLGPLKVGIAVDVALPEVASDPRTHLPEIVGRDQAVADPLAGIGPGTAGRNALDPVQSGRCFM